MYVRVYPYVSKQIRTCLHMPYFSSCAPDSLFFLLTPPLPNRLHRVLTLLLFPKRQIIVLRSAERRVRLLFFWHVILLCSAVRRPWECCCCCCCGVIPVEMIKVLRGVVWASRLEEDAGDGG